MREKSASGVLAALRGSTYRNVDLASLLAAALLGQGASRHARVRLVRSPAFLSILRGVLLLS